MQYSKRISFVVLVLFCFFIAMTSIDNYYLRKREAEHSPINILKEIDHIENYPNSLPLFRSFQIPDNSEVKEEIETETEMEEATELITY